MMVVRNNCANVEFDLVRAICSSLEKVSSHYNNSFNANIALADMAESDFLVEH